MKGADNGYEVTVPFPHTIKLEIPPCNFKSEGNPEAIQMLLRSKLEMMWSGWDGSERYNVRASGSLLLAICS